MTDETSLGNRMKAYERCARTVLPRRTHTITRVDGRHFHTVLAKCEKPFDARVCSVMSLVGLDLCKDIAGARFAYVQSDECSVLSSDYGSIHSQPHFGGVVQKLASTAAALATRTWNTCLPDLPGTFDGRVFVIPDYIEVLNYFVWRQRDAIRNSIQGTAQALFSHKTIQGLNCDQLQEKMWQESDTNWAAFPVSYKQGACIVQHKGEGWKVYPAQKFIAQPQSWLDSYILTEKD